MTLAEIFPDPATLLTLEPEELGGALLEVLNGTQERFSQTTFTSVLDQLGNIPVPPQWRDHDPDRIRFAIAEAFAWLERAGLIMEDYTQIIGGATRWRVLTRRGRELRSRDDVRAYRAAADLPSALVHPEILPKVRSAFIRGDYEVAVFAAFRAVEVAVRKAGGFRDDALGIKLMRDAFNPDRGPLTDMATVSIKEREAVSNLFAGAIGAAKNPGSHREVEMGRTEAVRLILFASHLLSVVELRSKS